MGTLIEDLNKWYEDNSYPPEPYELGDGTTESVVVNRESLDHLRWGTEIQIVYRRGTDYVAVKDVEPATEMQDWGDYGEPEIYPVKQVEVTTVKYERI